MASSFQPTFDYILPEELLKWKVFEYGMLADTESYDSKQTDIARLAVKYYE